MKKIILSILILLITSATADLMAQTGYVGFHLEGISSDLKNSSVNLRSSISNQSGTMLFQESNVIAIDSTGKWWVTVGSGSYLSGIYSTIDSIPFQSDTCFLELEFEIIGVWQPILTSQLNYVPFSFHSLTTDQNLRMSVDVVDTLSSGVYVIYDSIWKRGVVSADYAINSNYASNTDSAVYTDYLITQYADTTQYAFLNDSSNYSFLTSLSDSTTQSNYSNFSGMAIDGAWLRNGNSQSNQSFLGSINNYPVEIKTNGFSRLQIDSGRFYHPYFLDSSVANVSFRDMSFRFSGTSGSDVYPSFSNRLHFAWIADEAAMRTGIANDTTFSSTNVGYASHTFGTNNICKAKGALIQGDSNVVDPIGEYSFVLGKGHYVNQRYNMVSGQNNFAGYERNVVMGYNCSVPFGYGSVAMGINVYSGGNPGPTWSFGKDIRNDRYGNMVLGHGINTGTRGAMFVYSDYVENDTLNLAAYSGNSFRVRASGGVWIYTDPSLTTGVCLFPGSGSWSTTSNRESKNIIEVDPKILDKIDSLNVFDWSYKLSESTHVGPMAQDVMKVFKYGESNKMLNSVDMDGILMQCAKELNTVYNQLENSMSEPVQLTFEDLKRRIYELENKISNNE